MATAKKTVGKESFAGIPRIVMDHPDYIGLSGSALRLLLELSRQYRGKNSKNQNGDLTASWSLMCKRGFRSKATLAKAVKELLDARLISKTREGRFINPGGICALYALSWYGIDECNGKLDVKPTIRPLRNFSQERQELKRMSTNNGSGATPHDNNPGTESVPTRPRNCTDIDLNTVPSPSPIAPVSGSIRRFRLVQKPNTLLTYHPIEVHSESLRHTLDSFLRR